MNLSLDLIKWLAPSLLALFAYGIGQGLVKKYISEVPPARFCLYFVFAKMLVNLSFFFTQEHPDPFLTEGRSFLLTGVFAYILDGTAWILYFESIMAALITILGTFCACYPGPTLFFGPIFPHGGITMSP